jgi:MFS family permease
MVKATPLPIKTMAILCIVILCEPVSYSLLFPFVYFMVKDFHLGPEADTGYYVGFITASFALAQLCSSMPWGWLSDKFGRRPVLLFGLVGNSVSIVCFGLSKSLTWCIVARAACGLLNGNIGVAKSVLGEITDSTNQGAAFALIGLNYSIGTLF